MIYEDVFTRPLSPLFTNNEDGDDDDEVSFPPPPSKNRAIAFL